MITKERQNNSIGYIYKTTHLPTGRFYIGESTRLSFHDISEYLGSGIIINRLLKKYPRRDFLKEVLVWSDDELELYETEARYINEELSNTLNINIRSHPQSVQHESTLRCIECGGRRGQHLKKCQYFNKPLGECEECECRFHNHYKFCSKYVQTKKCSECGSRAIHKENCSKSVKRKVCGECSARNGQHKVTCSKYKRRENWKCLECGNKAYTHKITCSKFKQRKACSECGGRSGHKNGCSRQKIAPPCDECSGKNHQHFKSCSKYKKNK